MIDKHEFLVSIYKILLCVIAVSIRCISTNLLNNSLLSRIYLDRPANKKNIALLFGVLLSYTSIGQNIPPPPKLAHSTEFVFSELLEKNNLHNFKAGLCCSAQRNDTIFVVFYNSLLNNLMYFSIGVLYDDKNYDCIDINTVRLGENIRLRESGNILCSRYITKYEVKKEEIILFRQTLSWHRTVKSEDDYDLFYKVRILYYSKQRGIFRIDYDDSFVFDGDPKFEWYYKEGDFIF